MPKSSSSRKCHSSGTCAVAEMKVNMKKLVFVALVLLPLMGDAGGLLGDATLQLNQISKQLDKVNAIGVDAAVSKIERAELAQNLQVDSLVKRVVELEATIKKQQDLIFQYQKVVGELQLKVGGTK